MCICYEDKASIVNRVNELKLHLQQGSGHVDVHVVSIIPVNALITFHRNVLRPMNSAECSQMFFLSPIFPSGDVTTHE